MQVTRAPARLGWSWVTAGFGIVARRPLPMVGLTTLMLFSLALPSLLPWIGAALSLIITPLLSTGFMQAVRLSEAGRPVSPWAIFEYFKPQHGPVRRRLMALGGIHGALALVVILPTTLIDGGILFKLITGGATPDPATTHYGSVLFAACVWVLLYTPIQMSMWFAPVLVAWHGLMPSRAMFYSLVGVWRNKAVFTVYLLGWLAMLIGLLVAEDLLGRLAVLIGLLIGLSVAEEIASLASHFQALPIWPIFLVLLAALYCSFWPSYRDLIQDTTNPTPGPQQVD